MKPPSVDDPQRSEPASLLRQLGETLATAASFERLSKLIARLVRETTAARRVSLVARDDSGRLAPAADVSPAEISGWADGQVLAMPLVARAGVEAILVVQDGRPDAAAALDAFLPQAALAIAAARALEGGQGDGAAAHARIAGRVVHKVNNRLGAIHIYAYLLAERLRRGEDVDGLEIATKLCNAVDRLGADVAALAVPGESPAGEQRPSPLVVVVQRCLDGLAEELAGRGVEIVRQLDDAGAVLLHEPTIAEALGTLLRDATTDGGDTVTVRTLRRAPSVAEIAVECQTSVDRVSDALFGGEPVALGRALLRDLVERHAARVRVTGGAGRMTTIHIELVASAG